VKIANQDSIFSAQVESPLLPFVTDPILQYSNLTRHVLTNIVFARFARRQFALFSIEAVLRFRGKAGLTPALPWQHGACKGKPGCFNSPPRKAGGQNLRMSSGESGSFRKEGPTEQVSFNFFLLNLYRPLGEPDLSKAPAFFFAPRSPTSP
jgi:hypothetical protein